jgi:polar amino acid transport system permease protein
MYASKEIWSDDSNVREMMIFLLIVYVALVALLVWGLNSLERALRIPGYGQLGGR